MKNNKVPYTPAKYMRSKKIEVFKTLSENFGSRYGVPDADASKDHVMNFQLDRLFTVIHEN